jgi:hypothetical protein
MLRTKRTSTANTYDLRYRRAKTSGEDGSVLDLPGDWEMISNEMKDTDEIYRTMTDLIGLAPLTGYEFQVRSVNALGPGGWSDSLILTTTKEGVISE